VSGSDAPILLLGETGTGKSMIAKYIHEKRDRKTKPLFTIDCAALAETLLESALFGHVKGAFTGAVSAKRGLLEEASGGTILLDEIGELSPSTQVKLPRAVQEFEIRPVGGNRSVNIDVRFISATSRDLEAEIEKNLFRKDLYFRLAVIPLTLPPLRQRKFDIPQFVAHFLEKFNRRYKKNINRVDPLVLQDLQQLPWKGNIRELENTMERMVLLADHDVLTRDLLYFSSKKDECREMETSDGHISSLKEVIQDAESLAIGQALELTEGNRTLAAKRLGIGRRTLYVKMETYGIH
jgi:transcriptional regulator with PAS, ATPase and Fis domain